MSIQKLITNAIKNINHPALSILALVDCKSKVHPNSRINRLTRFYNSSINKYSYIGPNCRIENCDIGSFCSISWDCQIGLKSHSLSHISTSPVFLEVNNGTGARWIQKDITLPQNKRTFVGNDVWIGSKVTVLAGISVGDGAVIGTGSIVTKDVPPYAIVAGNPARTIKKRFDEDMCNALSETKWWELEDVQLKELLGIFQTEQPDIETIKTLKSFKSKKQK